ncbi:hypothetical protein [Actinomadura sp. DC4]|uniref:hypothetical protein n=1 Tax=Actinomadura sp. DC4 TaxID=3055069 RepID=UPI0025B0AE46|nr:hypothetical protein [Actinomadura sp. DC4]
MIGLLAGCSDPAGAVRRERAAARKASPSPTATARKAVSGTWWQSAGTVKTADGLRIHTGALHPGRMRVAVTDVNGHAARTITVTNRAHGALIGHFTLTGVKLAMSPKTGTYGVTFHYRGR